MQLEFHDFIGGLGVTLILVCYFLLQIGRLDAHRLGYSVTNLIGASLILVSLSVNFNLSAALIEGFWVLISLIGIFRFFRSKKIG